MKFKFWLFLALFFSSTQVFATYATEAEAYQACVTKESSAVVIEHCNTKIYSGAWTFIELGTFGAKWTWAHFFNQPCATDQPINPSTGACSISPKDAGQLEICDNGTNPVNGANGNKFQVETDYTSAKQSGLELKRYYNSSYDPYFSWPYLGHGWRHSYAQQLFFVNYEVVAVRPDGHARAFILVSGLWQAKEADTNDKLEVITGGYRLTLGNDAIEVYNTKGQVTSITPLGGISQQLAYDASGRLSTVDDGYGHKLTFNYDPNIPKRLISVTNPAGKLIQYGYGDLNITTSLDDLTSVTYPDTKIRKYHYNESAYTGGVDLPHKLTGITDENAVRFAIYRYDSLGRGIGTEHAGGVEKATLEYGTNSTTITNVLGLKRTYTFKNILGVLKNTSISQPCSSCGGSDAAATGYDANGNITSRTDFKGNLTCYAYNSRNLEIVRVEGFVPTISCPANLAGYTPATGTTERKITTEWHTTWRVPVQIAEPKRITAYLWGNTASTCGAVGVLCSKTEQATSDINGGSGLSAIKVGLASINAYSYNARGQMLTADGPRTDVNDITTFAYYADTDSGVNNRKLLNTVTNALNHVTTYSNYDAHGQAGKITDANGVVTDFVRDARNRIYTITTTAPGATARSTNFRYSNGLLWKIITPDQGTIVYGYDAAHRLRTITNGAGEKLSYTVLDGLGNRKVEQTFAAGTTTASTTINRQFDAFGRLYKVLDAANKEVQVYAYDSQENLSSVTAKPDDDPAHDQVTSYELYDPLNRLVTLKDALLGVTNYGYDGLDHLASVKDPRLNVTRYVTNGLDNLTSEVSPDRGTISNTVFDEAGNLKTSTDARGKITQYTYDALNRMLSETYSDGSGVNYQYDQGVGAKGRLTHIDDSTGSTDWIYDTEGRLLQKTQTTGIVQRSVSYSYDPVTGRLATMTYPSGAVASYAYDSAGRVQTLSVSTNVQAMTAILSNITYRPLGPLASYLLPTVTNSPEISRDYNTDGQLISYSLADAAKTLLPDRLGNLKTLGTANTTTADQLYTYDALNRLTDMGIASSNLTHHYGYDSLGNRLSRKVNTITTSYAYNPGNNRFTTGNGYLYDAVGNITNNNSYTWTYNARGRLASVILPSSVVYNYGINGLGQRVSKTSTALTTGGRLYVYDEAGHLLGEYNNSGGCLSEHVYLGDLPVAVIYSGSSGGVYPVLSDHLGTPRQVINTAKQLRWQWDNIDPFGAQTVNQNPAGLGIFGYNLRFPGQFFDAETGLHYNYFRDYSPSSGRYIESDPIGLNGGLNTFGYVGGNPLRFVDPLGLRSLTKTESEFLNKHFGKCLDPKDLNIHERQIGNTNRALSFNGGFMSFPKKFFIDQNSDNELNLQDPTVASIFAHESFHQLQREGGTFVTIEGLWLQTQYSLGGTTPYGYSRSNDPNQMWRTFLNGNPERQAQMIEDYVFNIMGNKDTTSYQKIINHLEKACSCGTK